MKQRKYTVGVRAMPDQTNKEFKQTNFKPRTKNFNDEDKAYDYFKKLQELAKRNCYEAFILKNLN